MKDLHKDERIVIDQYSTDGFLIATFASINEASIKTGVGKGCISLCVQGKRKTTGGFIWKKNGGLAPPTN